MGNDTGTAIAVDRSGPAVAWAKGHLANGVDTEQLVAGLMKQGWPEYDARQVLDIALTTPDAAQPAMPVTASRVASPQRVMSYATPARKPAGNSGVHVQRMAIGAVMLVIGLTITIVTLSMASNGGTYVLCWGPIIFGLIRLITGFVGWLGSR